MVGMFLDDAVRAEFSVSIKMYL